MRAPLSNADKLRIQFRKSLRKGYLTNTELDPAMPPERGRILEIDEQLVVRVDSTKGSHYWFTDRRVLSGDWTDFQELLRYRSLLKPHWMFQDLWERLRETPSEGSQLKTNHFDRLEIAARQYSRSGRARPGIYAHSELFLVGYTPTYR